jgi:hypothetical protein
MLRKIKHSPLFSVVGQGILRKPDEQHQQQPLQQQQQQAKDQLDGPVHLDLRKYSLIKYTELDQI